MPAKSLSNAPATAASTVAFPALIPEPQLITYLAGVVQSPGAVDLCINAPGLEDEDSCGRFQGLVGTGEYVVQADMSEEFAPDEVPEEALDEAYQLDIMTDRAVLTARTEAGIRWGLITLADVLKAIPRHGSIPVARIIDWPTLRTRGVFMEDKWGPDLMELDDWKAFIDYLAARKMNNLGIGIYGCWRTRQYDGKWTEWLMTPVPDHPELKREWTIRWYSPEKNAEQQITYLPPIFEKDFFGDIVAYGQKRGVEVIPYVNSLGHNTLIPRMMPQFAAKNEAGEPQEFGYCVSNPDLIKFVTRWYQHIYEKYLKPNGVHTFHIQLDEVGREFCQCSDCSKLPMEQQLKDYTITLVKHLVSVGVQNVVIYNDQFTRHLGKNTLDQEFMQRLRDEGIYDNVIIDWWAYNNAHTYPDTHPENGLGLRAWVKPMTCYFNWSVWDARQRNIAVMLEVGHREGAEGAASYSVYDPAWALEFDALAEYSWNFRGAGPIHRFETKWAQMRADDDVLEAIRWMDAAADGRRLRTLSYYTYTYEREGKAWPRPYPEEALAEFAHETEAIAFMAHAGARARTLLDSRSDEISRSLIPEAARIEAYGVMFSLLTDLWTAIAARKLEPADARAYAPKVQEALAAVTEAMSLIEQNKLAYLIPAYMRDMSVLREYLVQLADDVAEVVDGKRQWSEVRFSVAKNIAQRENEMA
jgi:hypothetical protein